MGIIPFPVCRVGVSSERRKKLDALARALREARDGGADAARLLRDLFSARVEFNEIAGLDLGGRDGVLDSLRKAGSDGQRRAAKRLINAWNRIVVDGPAVDDEAQGRRGRAAPRRRGGGGGVARRRAEFAAAAPAARGRRRRRGAGGRRRRGRRRRLPRRRGGGVVRVTGDGKQLATTRVRPAGSQGAASPPRLRFVGSSARSLATQAGSHFSS